MHHGDPVERIAVAQWAGVDPHHVAVRVHDVTDLARLSKIGTVGDRPIDGLPARRVRLAGIDRVRPDQMMEVVERKRVTDANFVRMSRLDRFGGSLEGLDHLDHDRLGGVGRLAKGRHRRRGVGDRGSIDDDPLRADPLVGSGLALGDDDVAAQRVRAAPQRHDDVLQLSPPGKRDA